MSFHAGGMGHEVDKDDEAVTLETWQPFRPSQYFIRPPFYAVLLRSLRHGNKVAVDEHSTAIGPEFLH